MRHLRTCAMILAATLALSSGEVFAQSHYATKQAQESYDSGIKLERQAEEKNDMSYLQKAETKYRDAIAAEPNMVSAYIRLGYILYALKRSEEGVTLLEHVSKRHPDNIEIKHYLGLNLYEVGKLNEAELLLTEVIEKRQDLPEAYFVLGKINLDKRNSERSQTYFEMYAATAPNDAHAYRALSTAYIQARNVVGAETALTKLLTMAPNDVIAQINMGHVKYERGQIDEAVKYYEGAYKAAPHREDLLYTIASVYYLSGRYQEAIERFAKVLEKDDTHMSAQYFTADSYLKLGNFDKAESLFNELEKKMPEYRYIKLKQAYIRMRRGEPGAEAEVRQLMKESTHPDDLHFGAVMLRKQGAKEESLEIHQRLRDENPEKSIYGVYLAREYLEDQNYKEASEILMSLIEESIADSLAWQMLSFVQLRQGVEHMLNGEMKSAKGLFEQVQEMNVHTIQATCSLAQLYVLEGDIETAGVTMQAVESWAPNHPSVVKLGAQFDIMDGAHEYAVQRLKKLEETQGSDALGGTGWYLMAIAQSSVGNWEGAMQAVDNAEKYGVIDAPATAIVALHRAIDAYYGHQYEEAAQHLAKVESFKEDLDLADKVRFHYLKAISNIRLKKFAVARESLLAAQDGFEALDHRTQSEITTEGSLDLNLELSYVYYETGNYDSALSLIKHQKTDVAQSIEAAIRRKLGYQALKNNKAESALENFNRLNALGAMHSADQYNRVLAQLQTKKIQNPSATLEKYANQGIPEAALNYAIYLDNVGDAAKATSYYEQYVSKRTGKKADEVREMLATKQRVWGSSH